MESTGERPLVEGERGEDAADPERLQGYAVKAAAVAGLVLGLGRFVGYLDTVGDTDASGWVYLNWWAAWIAGVGLLAASLFHEDEDATGVAVLAFLGIVILLLGTNLPVGGFSFNLPF